mgnify:CR=1 FL=1
MTSHTNWYQIKVLYGSELPLVGPLQSATHFVGPHTYITNQKNAARLSQKSIADVYCKAMQSIFKRRHGETIRLTVARFSAELNDKQRQIVSLHDAIITERLETANFSPNKKVKLTARRNFN